jgi:EAL domain-containing protein (putative c-di-GMP-specific phosphodiesterase class I)
VNPANLNIEFTESIFSDNYQEINNKIDQIHALGLQVSIDDFGTGYSSLAREEELNVNCLKIDRHFVKKITKMKPEKNLISDIISMAHKLGHQVVAEGVENRKQLDYLLKHNCDLYQGYYFSQPLSEDDALAILLKNNIKD